MKSDPPEVKDLFESIIRLYDPPLSEAVAAEMVAMLRSEFDIHLRQRIFDALSPSQQAEVITLSQTRGTNSKEVQDIVTQSLPDLRALVLKAMTDFRKLYVEH